MSEVFDNLTANEDGSRSNSEGIVVHQPWMAQNPDDLKVHEGLAKFKTLGDFSKAHMDLNGEFGSFKENSIQKLGDNPTDEARDTYYTETGRPPSHDRYEFEAIEMPKGRERDMVLQDKIRKTAFEHGVSSSALKALDRTVVEHGVTQQNESDKLFEEESVKDTNALKDIWPGDAFRENTEKSKRTIEKVLDKMNVPESLGGKEGMLQEFRDIGLLDNEKDPLASSAKMKYFAAELFKLIGDDSIMEGLSASSNDAELKRTEGGIPVFKSYAGMNKDK